MHELAVRSLAERAAKDKDQDWEFRLADLRRWRKEMRDKLGLDEKKAPEKLIEGWAGGRKRTAVQYGK